MTAWERGENAVFLCKQVLRATGAVVSLKAVALCQLEKGVWVDDYTDPGKQIEVRVLSVAILAASGKGVETVPNNHDVVSEAGSTMKSGQLAMVTVGSRWVDS